MDPKTWKIEVWRVWRGSRSSWGRPWDEKSSKSCLGRFWSILAGLGSTKIWPKWPKMVPSGSQVGAKMGQVGAKMAILLRPFEELSWPFLVVLGVTFEKMAKVENQTTIQRFCNILGLGGSGWRFLGSILVDLGGKLGSLGRYWRQVGNFLATCWT